MSALVSDASQKRLSERFYEASLTNSVHSAEVLTAPVCPIR
jgi:hypothetical protein